MSEVPLYGSDLAEFLDGVLAPAHVVVCHVRLVLHLYLTQCINQMVLESQPPHKIGNLLSVTNQVADFVGKFYNHLIVLHLPGESRGSFT